MVFPRPGTTNISMTHSKDKCLDYIYMYLCTQLQRLFFSSTSNRSLFRGRRQGRQPLNLFGIWVYGSQFLSLPASEITAMNIAQVRTPWNSLPKALRWMAPFPNLGASPGTNHVAQLVIAGLLDVLKADNRKSHEVTAKPRLCWGLPLNRTNQTTRSHRTWTGPPNLPRSSWHATYFATQLRWPSCAYSWQTTYSTAGWVAGC